MTPGTALVTGVGRQRGIGAAVAVELARQGWDLCLAHWSAYDERIDLVRGADDPAQVAETCRGLGSTVDLVESDLADPGVPAALVATAAARGDLRGLVISHCESVDSGILDSTVEAWDRHFAVNARAVWLLVAAFGAQLPTIAVPGSDAARVVALTSDVAAHNLPYGASKAALDRIVLAAASELADRGVRANVINPGPVDTGWMSDEIREAALAATPAGRVGRPQDAADLVAFLFSPAGAWINGQVVSSNGGFA